jgi:serine/threonine protein phosphatase PrpC
VAIGTKSEFHWGYIGDGALKVINARGQKHECMMAHRSDSTATNVLNASLGPTLHGTPQFGRRPRKPGDVLLAGTDGVFDRVDDRFTRDVIRMAIYHHGNLTQAVLASLEQLASVSDSTGAFVCDDNLSLGILADGRRPTFQPEFWNAEVLNT